RLGREYVRPWEGPLSSDFWVSCPGAKLGPIPSAEDEFYVRLQGSLPAEFTLAGALWRLRMEGGAHRLTLAPEGEPPLVFPVDTLVAIARAFRAGVAQARPDGLPPPRFVAETATVRAMLIPR